MRLLFFALCSLPFVASAQLTGISVDIVTVHDGSVDPSLTGMTTYRVYADLTNEFDFVSAVFGDATYPLSLGSEGTIFQSAPVSFDFGYQVNAAFFGTFPTMEFDSWLTIGADSTDGANIQSTDDTMASALDLFNAGEGFVINDPIGGSWFNVYPCVGANDLVACAAANPEPSVVQMVACCWPKSRLMETSMASSICRFFQTESSQINNWQRLYHSAPTTWTSSDARTLAQRTTTQRQPSTT